MSKGGRRVAFGLGLKNGNGNENNFFGKVVA